MGIIMQDILCAMALLCLLPGGSPVRLAKGGSDDEREDKSRVGINLGVSCHLYELTLTLSALARILPHDTASSGRAPESEPSY